MGILSTMRKKVANLSSSLQHFPITILLTTLVTVLLIVLSEKSMVLRPPLAEGVSVKASLEQFKRIIAVVALGIPISLFIQFWLEKSKKKDRLIKVAAYLIGSIFLLVYFWYLLPNFNMVSLTRYFGFSLAFYLLALIEPYFYRRDHLEAYIMAVISKALTTIAYSAVLYFGIAAILATLNTLLGINIYSNLYLYIWFIVVGIFAPILFLGSIPMIDEMVDNNQFPIIKALLVYIFLPLISVYTLVLYLYFAKIVMIWEWPVGIVGHLVLWYSIISTAVLFLVSPYSEENKWVKRFSNWFPKLVLPLIILMFMSLGIRIKAYGITENRYFVLAAGLWVLFSLLYLILSSRKRKIVLPLSLAVMAFLSVWGPWSAYSVSVASQNNRFIKIISRYDMIKDNKLEKPVTPITKEDEKEINEILTYFNRSHSLSQIRYLPENYALEDTKEYFGFAYQKDYNTKYFKYSIDFKTIRPLEIAGYNYWFDLNGYNNVIYETKEGLKINYNYKNKELDVWYHEPIFLNLAEYADRVTKKYNNSRYGELNFDEMIFSAENAHLIIKIIFKNISGKMSSINEVLEYEPFSGTVFIAIK